MMRVKGYSVRMKKGKLIYFRLAARRFDLNANSFPEGYFCRKCEGYEFDFSRICSRKLESKRIGNKQTNKTKKKHAMVNDVKQKGNDETRRK